MRCCNGILFWAVVILTVASTYPAETHDGERSDDIPTAQECRPHIEAAIRLYQSGELDLDNPSATAEDEREQNDDGPIHNEGLEFEDSNEPQDDEGELEQHREQEEDEQGNPEDSDRNDDDDDEDDETDENEIKDVPNVEDADEEDDDSDIDNKDEILEDAVGEDDENEINADADGETGAQTNLEDDEAVNTDDEAQNSQNEETDEEHNEAQDDETDKEEQDEDPGNEPGEEPSEAQDDEHAQIPENDTEESESQETADEPETADTEGEVAEESGEHIEQFKETEGSDDELPEDNQSTREERSTDTDDDYESEPIENADQQHTQVGEDNQEDGKTPEELDDGEELVQVSDSNQTHAEDGEHVETDTTEAEDEDEEEEEVTVSGPGPLRTREHIEEILHLDDDGIAATTQKDRASAESLRNLKRMYEATIKPLEGLYKFKDISNRHLGDAELFSQPIVVFFGPLGSGKSTVVNYLLGIEDTHSAIKTGTDPNSNFFNVLMHGDSEQIIDGTQLAADWAFSSLQKFGQSFLDKLRGRKLPNALLRKVTVVDTPGISEHRKSNERLYPFNDVCQWFIDRADLIFVVFDPSKLDIGMELEALFDQLKGRESHVRLLLNKADTVSPVELLRAQSSLLWNLSPLVGTPEPPTVFAGSFWSRPYLHGSAAELLYSSEVALLEDIQEAVENRVENKVALARRHAVRVRNHAKMVDCYLNTYYNHKSFFSNKRKVADEIIDNPHMYRIYEGLSTLANVSRYDLPDPDVYRDFFRLNPLFDFKPLSSTCSYFKGCPLDKLDITIAYDLPELVGKYHKALRALGVH